ncbi:MAG: ferritin-like domain-containing protein [Phycisphaerales bacterium]|nr:ferritin-like domain-containing protein [Phycisphaerales bacterium]
MKLDHLEKLYVTQLKDAYSAEKQLLQALPKLRDNAHDEKLREAFEDHLGETKAHVERIERIFQSLDNKPAGHRCRAMEGLVEEGEEVLGEDGDPGTLDAALICAAQKVEHYEIATYGCLREYARLLGHEEAVALLDQTLEEEKNADLRLTQLAEDWINQAAMHEA